MENQGNGRGSGAPAGSAEARGDRTRRRIAETVIALIEEGDFAPTAKSVADRAGVSMRLIFHHFHDMEALYGNVLTLQMARHWRAVPRIEPDLPRSERVERTVHHRSVLFEAIAPVRRAAAVRASVSPLIEEGLGRSDAVLRAWIELTFRPELDTAGEERRELLDAIDAATSWEAWERLRSSQGLPAPAAARVMVLTLGGLLH